MSGQLPPNGADDHPAGIGPADITLAEIVPSQTVALAAGIAADDIVTRRRLRLNRDPSRVVARLFIPGSLPPELDSRAQGVVDRILALDETEVDGAYQRVLDGFAGRHRDLPAAFEEHYRTVEHRMPRDTPLSERRRLLIGAVFTQEHALQGAAFTNPSMVPHPDQSGLAPGDIRFLMSARAIGEGHLSCVEFRTGVVSADGAVRVEDPLPYACVGGIEATEYRRALLEAAVTGTVADTEVLAYLHHHLPARFTEPELDRLLGGMHPQLLVLEQTHRTLAEIHWFTACQYRLEYPADTRLSERVLWPSSPAERRGIEDVRLVRFVEDDGSVRYLGTYTAYDGERARCQLLETTDFRSFEITQMFGDAVGNKGLALFPRRINGQYVALSRADHESNSVTYSPDCRLWHDPRVVQAPDLDWEVVQLGNCGSPIETEAGWLVLTHGVGPMRVYAIGAVLLDLDDPVKVVGRLEAPLLTAAPDERDGYVPNVVYSCGALRHGDLLVIPYGFGDMGIEFATVPVSRLIERMTA